MLKERDFIPQQYLPQYNICAIETFVHSIPELPDYFISINDDTIFLRPTTLSDYLSDDESTVYGTGVYDLDQTVTRVLDTTSFKARIQDRLVKVSNAATYRLFGLRKDAGRDHWYRSKSQTKELYCSAFPQETYRTLPHFPLVLSKRDLEIICEKFKPEIESCRQEKFRGPDALDFFSLAFSYAHNRQRTIKSDRKDLFFKLTNDSVKLRRALSLAEEYAVICLNDCIPGEEPVAEEIEQIVGEFVERKYREFSR